MITRRTFIRSSALVAATLVLGGATGGLAGCASGADVLRVGTKIDVPGFGFQNPETGNIEGMEVDIARELAKRPEFQGKNIVCLLPDTGERYLSIM
mgnify:CR=1 FL=1